MRCGPRGLTLASGLLLSTVIASIAVAETASLRFVPQPDLIKSIDPNRAPLPPAGLPQKPASAAEPSAAASGTTAVAQQAASKRAMPSSWPVTLKEAKDQQEEAAPGRADAWSPAEIKDAQQRCAAILKRVAAVVIHEDPIKEGSCGDPAPVQLISIGKKPEVVISPPAIVNCEMVEALHTWISTGLQPLARQHLGGPIIKIAKMSDYSCRNAYGRARGRMSEHGRANALDIAGFTTAKGDSTMLLADWGQTQRDIRRQIAAAKAKADAQQKQRLAAERQGQENARTSLRQGTIADGAPVPTRAAAASTGSLPPSALGVTSGAPGGGIARGSVIDGIPRVTVTMPGAAEAESPSPFDPPNRLGGPKPNSWAVGGTVVTVAAPGGAVAEIRKQRFLRGAHAAACKIFGTVLGPEANNAHRNHFHVDLAERGASGAFCQ